MKKRNEEKHRRIFSEGKEKEIFRSHQHRESHPCFTKEKPHLKTFNCPAAAMYMTSL